MRKLSMKRIDENTAVSIGLVVLFVGAIAWLTTMAAKVDHSEDALKIIANSVVEIKERLSRIEGALNVNSK